MSVSETMRYCPKYDNGVNLQHDGSAITVDIAHQGELVREALRKMESEIIFPPIVCSCIFVLLLVRG